MVSDQQSPFVMNGTRSAISQGLRHVEAQVDAIEGAVSENPGLAFDLAKTLIESTCRTILRERDRPYAEDDDLQKLFRMVRDNLPILPFQESQETAVRQSITQTITWTKLCDPRHCSIEKPTRVCFTR